MPFIKAPATVLVTGASGFIAVWGCKALLDTGYTDGAFDEAVKGVDGIVHTASPFHFQADDPQDLIEPAVKGTVGILESVNKYALSVQRVVITSSAAAIVEAYRIALHRVEQKGKDATPLEKYRASKTLAEKAAWGYVESNRLKWDIATVNPPMVFGPLLHQVASPNSLNTSISSLHKILHSKEETPKEVLLAPTFNFIDVRDVALAHVRVLEVPEAGGQRFIVSGGPYCWQDILDVLAPYPAKARKLLGIDFKSLEGTVRKTEANLRRRGWGIDT
ncbi:methylglyoxal reductase (NADPH-dependent) gre2 [Ceratobasidium sp. 423]|nr:methylglyoxal reductase (NADPH-dependent) gre2 [Ceratobasidium sp. 423]